MTFLWLLWVIKQWRQLVPSTHGARELLTNVWCSGVSGSSAKERRALKMRSTAAGHQKLTATNREWIKEADSLTTTWEVAEKLKVDHSTVIRYLKQLGKVKKPSNWVPHELNTNPRTVALKSYSTQQRTISRSDRDMWRQVNFIWQPAQWLDQEAAPKHFPEPMHQ